MSTYAYSCGRSIPLFAGRFQPLADKDRETASVVMKYLGLSRTTIELWFRKHETSWLDSLSDNVTPGIGPKQTEKQWQQVRILIFAWYQSICVCGWRCLDSILIVSSFRVRKHNAV